jgi:hypothetical protein
MESSGIFCLGSIDLLFCAERSVVQRKQANKIKDLIFITRANIGNFCFGIYMDIE